VIPEQTIRKIQDQLDIVEVIGGYIPLKKAGRNFKGLCPFHPEKTPSFMVYPTKQFYICYGCSAGGDLISFVMKHEHLEFSEAVEVLAQKAGVPVTQVAGSRTSKTSPDLYRAHELAADFYHELLLNSPEAEPARRYLEKRGLTPETWKKFHLGYAPSRWDGLLLKTQEAGLTPELLERGGLVIPKAGGGKKQTGERGWYDRFRARAIFPIWDARGRVIAFGGRILEDASGPKYMNSPETELYVKGRVLYGMHLASTQIREQDFCIVVEGYMDLVTPYQHGIRNVVASMGTSLTEQQVKLIRRHTRHVVMVYDADYAGEMATLRGLDLLLEAEMRVKVASLPGGSDPDTLIREHGVDAFIKAIQGSQELFDYKLGLLTRNFDAKTLEGRVQICQEILPTIKRVPNAIQRGEYIRQLGESLGVAESLLWKELARVKLNTAWQPEELAVSPAPAAAMQPEDLLAGLLLEEPKRIAQIEGRLALENLKDPVIRHIVERLLEASKQGSLPKDHRHLAENMPREITGQWESRLARWLAGADSIAEKDHALDDVLARIRRDRSKASLENLQTLIHQAEQAGDGERAEELILEYNRLIKAHAAGHAVERD